MRWDFSTRFGPVGSGQNSPVELFGLRIYKTLYDDNNVELAEMITTAEDAFLNAEDGFLEEYRVAALALFTEQLNNLFEARDVYTPSLPSLGSLFGGNIRAALADIVVIKNGKDV
jgi:hypothetical protein